MSTLFQPIFSSNPEPSHPRSKALSLAEFLDLLRAEEDYYPGEQQNTKLMITRLRKIFYDQWGWNSELIRDAAAIKTRYVTKVLEDKVTHSKPVRRFKDKQYQPKHRVIVYSDHDKVYGASRAGQVPFIYKNDHEEVNLPDGYFCDIAHILAGLDAYNHPQIVTPLPKWLSFLAKIFPHVDKNTDIVTWLGDIASSAGDFLFGYFNNGKKMLSLEKQQVIINRDAPGSDMLGNIDAFVIANLYDVGSTNGQRVSDILADYYVKNKAQANRIPIFCKAIGLSDWDGTQFSNEKKWLHAYKKELKNNICFQVFSLTNEKITSIWLPLIIWFGAYKKVLKKKLLLELFLNQLKKAMKQEISSEI